MTEDERIEAALDAVLTWEKETEAATEAWHFEDFEALQREAWEKFSAKITNIIRKES